MASPQGPLTPVLCQCHAAHLPCLWRREPAKSLPRHTHGPIGSVRLCGNKSSSGTVPREEPVEPAGSLIQLLKFGIGGWNRSKTIENINYYFLTIFLVGNDTFENENNNRKSDTSEMEQSDRKCVSIDWYRYLKPKTPQTWMHIYATNLRSHIR